MIQAHNHACRLCGGIIRKKIIPDIFTVYNDSFTLQICENCSFVTIHPMPSDKTLQRYYDQNYWHAEGKENDFITDTLYKLRMMNIVTAIQNQAQPDAKILDWGCGDGAFIRLLRAHGYRCFGIDAYREELNSPYIRNATIDNTGFPEAHFDVITCLHVLEHVDNPLNSIEKALQLLKTGGLMIVEVPNIDSLGFRIFKSRWQPLELPTHLNHFTLHTLQLIFQTVGKTQILRNEFFSHRISPSAFVLSVFSALSPKNVRAKHKGRYPLPLKTIYLILQLIAYPIAILGTLTRNGEIVRIHVRKSG